MSWSVVYKNNDFTVIETGRGFVITKMENKVYKKVSEWEKSLGHDYAKQGALKEVKELLKR